MREVHVTWRCKRCGAATDVEKQGGFLLCSCDVLHTDWEFRRPGGRWTSI